MSLIASSIAHALGPSFKQIPAEVLVPVATEDSSNTTSGDLWSSFPLAVMHHHVPYECVRITASQ